MTDFQEMKGFCGPRLHRGSEISQNSLVVVHDEMSARPAVNTVNLNASKTIPAGLHNTFNAFKSREKAVSSYRLSIGEGGGELWLQDLLLRPLHQLVAAVAAPNVHLARLRDHRCLACLDAVWTNAGARVVRGHPANLEQQKMISEGHMIRAWSQNPNTYESAKQPPG